MRKTAESMIKRAEQLATKDQPSCPASCKVVSTSIQFSAIPKKFLTSYSDRQKCLKHKKETLSSPLVYTGAVFKSAKEFAENFSQFSQGKGQQGGDLYKRCDGACSPQFNVEITPLGGESYKQSTKVICGEARDKSDGQYILKTTLVQHCSKS